MGILRIGDIVARKSYGLDVLFKVANIQKGENGENIATLKGMTCRLEADAPESDLMLRSGVTLSGYAGKT